MEHYWFVLTLARADEPQLHMPDGDWDAQFRDAVADEAVVADASTPGAPCGPVPTRSWTTWSRRTWIRLGPRRPDGIGPGALIQVIYEYSRHAGHLDLLREAIDGPTGE